MIQDTPVILCGGSGSRLWPLSRTELPKHFLCQHDLAQAKQYALLKVNGFNVTVSVES